MRTTPRTVVAALLAAGLVSTASSAAEAKTLVVAVTGSDNGGCGGKATPCHSISQAVAKAAPGTRSSSARDGTGRSTGTAPSIVGNLVAGISIDRDGAVPKVG